MKLNVFNKMPKKLRALPIWSCVSAVICAPVSVSVLYLAGIAALIAFANSTSDFDPSPLTRMSSNRPGFARNSDAVVGSNNAKVAPPGERTSPYEAIPTSVNSRLPDCATTFTVSPTTYLPFFADASSSATSFGPMGHSPCEIVHKAPLNFIATLPNVGGPWPSEPRGFPSLPIMRANA
ncbi:unannotated protein [freshwater metagenome]|uniref:Unannotated protein n=1 Tax=freshwater metagenome TaxID=449393 RepID=A0A6J6MQT0_9ZZZZ